MTAAISTKCPDAWDAVSVGSLGQIVSGGTPSRQVQRFWNGGIPWVTPTEITALRDKWLSVTKECITEMGLRASAAKLLPPQSVVITTRATLGARAITNVALTTNQGFKSIVPNTEVEPLWCYYAVELLQREMKRLAVGTTFLEISKGDFESIPLCRPRKPEQCRIAEILDTLDTAIWETAAVVAKLRQAKAGLLHDLLTRGLDEHGQLRDPDRHPEQFHDSPVGRIPSEWLASELEQFVPSAEYGISNALNDAGPTPILRMNNLSDGEVDLSDLKFTHARVPDHLLLCPADVLFNRTNSMEHVGRTGIWRGQLPYAGFASYLVRLNPHPKRMLSELLNLILNRPENQLAMRRFATPGVHQVNINPTNLKRLLVAAPKSLDEQARIIERLGRADECINGEERELSKLHSLKRGLAHDLLTGRVRVKVGGGA